MNLLVTYTELQEHLKYTRVQLHPQSTCLLHSLGWSSFTFSFHIPLDVARSFSYTWNGFVYFQIADRAHCLSLRKWRRTAAAVGSSIRTTSAQVSPKASDLFSVIKVVVERTFWRGRIACHVIYKSLLLLPLLLGSAPIPTSGSCWSFLF